MAPKVGEVKRAVYERGVSGLAGQEPQVFLFFLFLFFFVLTAEFASVNEKEKRAWSAEGRATCGLC